MALVISQVFGEPVPAAPLAGHQTILEALQAGIASQLAVLDDAGLTGTGQSSAEVLGVSGTVVAEKLTDRLLREVVMRGSRGGPLFPLASQLNDDLTHLQGRRLEGLVSQLTEDLRDTLAQLASTRAVPPVALGQLPPVAAGFTGRVAELAVLSGVVDPGGVGAAVAVVTGLPGVGKTALAVQAGHDALERERRSLSTCTDMTRCRWSRNRRWTRCCVLWVCQTGVSRPVQMPGRRSTDLRWPRLASRCSSSPTTLRLSHRSSRW